MNDYTGLNTAANKAATPRLQLYISRVVLLGALTASTLSLSDVYKTVDEQGQVSFGDQPSAKATEIVIEATNTTPATQTRQTTDSEPQAPDYRSLAISAPSNNTIIPNGLVPFWVTVSVQPKLLEGHQLQLLVDDQVIASTSATRIQVPSLSRGQHYLQLRINDLAGRPLKHSKKVVLFAYRP